ncbi:NTP transferase domain-containing protein [Candidatus Stoquefichus massiliensis]|uniref:NTP transferase domain-containing protein n=1 Tax=Candidatus Stoquefichus massiliensis TaxID=1470350 RepID=UPI000481D3DA|nr:NTP transferase domain-containing protein [Candidatus Stoquefichus massiliensis]
MNIIALNIIKKLYQYPHYTQREMSSDLNCSLGTINKNIKILKEKKYLSYNNEITNISIKMINKNRPTNAIILAAGIGLRMTPINKDMPKGFVEIYGKTITENIIEKLHNVGITEIHIVVGYMKEQYEHLIDKYGIHLIVNNRYLETNNIYSLYLAREYLHNSYIVPSDIWFQENPFHNIELNSWYLFDANQKVITKYMSLRNQKVIIKNKKDISNKPLSIAYLNYEDSIVIKNQFDKLNDSYFLRKHYYWEDIIIGNSNVDIYNKTIKGKSKEINTFKDLRDLDPNSNSLYSDIIQIILNSLNINILDIKNITLSKKGMTNRSFMFETNDQKYIMRIPGEGTNKLINRYEEGEVYKKINHLHICDEVIYFDKNNGYKLTKYINNSKVCNPVNLEDLKNCMKFLKNFHSLNIKVDHCFNLYKKIDFYEKLRNGNSLYPDYEETKQNVFKLKTIIDNSPKVWTLTHIDAVPDNFLIYQDKNEKKIKLIDWEYAAMQDAHVDIAMFCIYAMYDKKQIDQLIDIYFENQCLDSIRLKIYCYIATCGLLWSNWCEYKYHLGVEFGEYSLIQYRYAKEYYYYAMKFIERSNI